MEKISFLPQWYLENKMNKKRRVMKFCIGILVIIDLIFLDILILRLNKVKLLEDNIKKKIAAQNSIYLNEKKENLETDKTLSAFFVFIKSVPIDINFKYISIENMKVNMEVNPESFDYVNFINELEEKNQFIIKSLETPSEQENKNFKVNLEMK
jgi:hypothetical protein